MYQHLFFSTNGRFYFPHIKCNNLMLTSKWWWTAVRRRPAQCTLVEPKYTKMKNQHWWNDCLGIVLTQKKGFIKRLLYFIWRLTAGDFTYCASAWVTLFVVNSFLKNHLWIVNFLYEAYVLICLMDQIHYSSL